MGFVAAAFVILFVFGGQCLNMFMNEESTQLARDTGVCASTLTTKQHVLVDVAGGILLAELCLRAGRCPSVSGTYRKILDGVNDRLFARFVP